MVSDLLSCSSLELGKKIAARQISSLEIVKSVLERIQQVNPELNAVVHLNEEQAISTAAKIDEDIKRNGSCSPIHGVPMTLKDSLDTKGVKTTWGTQGRKEVVPTKDATLVKRLKEAGAVLIGKTNTPEFTLAPDTDNLVYGRTNNPFDISKSPGGSSGGAAAIVSSCGSYFDIGSDTGGSIRMPAHCCGIPGIKPTSGRVPRTGHCISYAHGPTESLTQNGPMSRWVEDLLPILKIISGPDWIDPFVVPMEYGHNNVEINDLRVAFHTDNKLMEPTSEIQQLVLECSQSLAKAGAKVSETFPEALLMVGEIDGKNSSGDGRAWVRRLLEKSNTTEPSAFIKQRLADATELPASEYTGILEQVDEYRSRMTSFIQDFDVILCPTSARTALLPGQAMTPEYKFVYYTSAYNITGWPAGVVRVGTSNEGMPISVQVIGKPWQEHVVIAVMKFLESQFGGWSAPSI